MALDNMGLTALDPRVAAVEKFIQDKQVPSQQVPEFLMSMGADPRLAGLVMRYQRLKAVAPQAQQGPPPTSTVAQDVQNAEMQKAMAERQMAMQKANEVQRILAAQRLAAQRTTGIGQLPAPVMDNANFAGGGIVAFQEGGVAYAAYPDDEIEQRAKQIFYSINPGYQRGYQMDMRDAQWKALPQEERARYRAQAAANYNPSSPLAETLAETAGTVFLPNTRKAISNYPGFSFPTGTNAREYGASTLEFLSQQGGALKDIGTAYAKDITRPVVPFLEGFFGLGGEDQSVDTSKTPLEEIDVNAIRNLRLAPPSRPPSQTGDSTLSVGIPSLPRSRSLNEAIAEIEALQKERGIGNWTQDAEKMIAARLAKDQAEAKKDRYMALAEAGFKMAEAASKPGARLLGSVGVGGQSFAQSVAAQNKAAKEAIRAADQQRIGLMQARDELNAGNINTAIKLVEEDKTRVHETALNAAKIAADRFNNELRARVDQSQLAAMNKQVFIRAIGDAQNAYAEGIINLPTFYINWNKLKPEEKQQAMDAVYNRTFGQILPLFPEFAGSGISRPVTAIGFK
jgi:hypothetical protein